MLMVVINYESVLLDPNVRASKEEDSFAYY